MFIQKKINLYKKLFFPVFTVDILLLSFCLSHSLHFLLTLIFSLQLYHFKQTPSHCFCVTGSRACITDGTFSWFYHLQLNRNQYNRFLTIPKLESSPVSDSVCLFLHLLICVCIFPVCSWHHSGTFNSAILCETLVYLFVSARFNILLPAKMTTLCRSIL